MTSIIYPDDTPYNFGDNPRKIYERDYANNLVTVKDELGRRTLQYMDINERVVKEERHGYFAGFLGPVITTTQYDGRGNRVRQTDPRGNVTTYYYDLLNRLVKAQLPVETFHEGGKDVSVVPTVQFEYDTVGNKTGELRLMPDGSWYRTTFEYDTLGRIIRSRAPYTDYLGTAQVSMRIWQKQLCMRNRG